MFKRKDPSQLQKQLKSFEAKKTFESDGTEWKITQDKKTGEGSAVIRFLPEASETANTFVKLVNHGFQKNGKWYIENCSSTHGDWDSCPACAWIKEQNWDYNNEADKKAMYGSGVTRKTSFWANILVVKDPGNKENEGKIFKFRFGKKIMDKVQAEVDVDVELGETPCDVTCPFEGKNFLMKLKKVGGNNNYDDSKFQGVSAIDNIDDEAVQKEIFEGMHDIMSIVAKDKFKSMEDLSTAFNRVMGTRNSTSNNAASDFDKEMESFSGEKEAKKEAVKDKVVESAAPEATSGALDDDLDALLDEI